MSNGVVIFSDQLNLGISQRTINILILVPLILLTFVQLSFISLGI